MYLFCILLAHNIFSQFEEKRKVNLTQMIKHYTAVQSSHSIPNGKTQPNLTKNYKSKNLRKEIASNKIIKERKILKKPKIRKRKQGKRNIVKKSNSQSAVKIPKITIPNQIYSTFQTKKSSSTSSTTFGSDFSRRKDSKMYVLIFSANTKWTRSNSCTWNII